ncbi:hypothetical protein Poli38472_005990 [Pythium oligandrum]|uniref:sarcosine oxidasee (formaldehyde-forming) n=1 Tax=Pythium oligandrum TaxID=41045 RepID=A0A8K1FR18_PYTOL|nr:hypothetical protein Poli38472_005990 [Pythium oligandrum]|eukprot:TMW68522.1 hypothetical protein Poli38472_005990 [Pythium oligandrum]
MSSPSVYDVVVVGAGLMGSSAAYHATLRGKRVLLLEQFEFLHSQGSSHGPSRIFRVAYSDATYTKMCIDSLAMWRELEKLTGKKLLEMTGELDFTRERSTVIDEVAQVLKQCGEPYEVLTPAQVNERFPGFHLPETAHAVYSANAAILNPTLAMQLMQELAAKQGAELRDHARVVSLVQQPLNGEEEGIVVTLADWSVFHARQCIVTAGPWTKQLIASQPGGANIDLQPVATFGTYWKCDPAHEEVYAPSRFPVFINYDSPEVYGFPLHNRADGIKVCSHKGADVDPEKRQDVTTQPAHLLASVQDFIKSYMPHVDSNTSTRVDHCMYTMTKDEDFILDFVDAPHASNPSNKTKKQLVVGAGFSGHGSKMTPVIGKILADLAIDGQTTYSLDKFKLARLQV